MSILRSPRPVPHRSRPPLIAALVLASAALAGAAPALPPTSAAAAVKLPHVSSGNPHNVTDTSAELTGSINPRGQETSWYFQYGPTTAYGSQTPTTAAGDGEEAVKVSQLLTGLTAGATYHYRLVAVTATSGTLDGRDRTFTSKSAVQRHASQPKTVPLRFVLPRVATVVPYGGPVSLAGTLSGEGGANQRLVLQASPYPYLGAFTNLGDPTTTNVSGAFSFRVPSISQNTKLRVGTFAAPVVYSRIVTVQVAALVTLHAQSAKLGLVRFYGTVTPSERGAPVAIQLLRTGHRPVSVGTTTARGKGGSTSRFSVLLDVRRSGSYRALVKVSNGRQVAGHSHSVFVHGAPRRRRKK